MPAPSQETLKPESDGPNSRGFDSAVGDSVGAVKSAERRWVDWLLAVVVVVANPLTINFGRYQAPLHQDSFAYAYSDSHATPHNRTDSNCRANADMDCDIYGDFDATTG